MNSKLDDDRGSVACDCYTAVGDLAIALGMLMAHEGASRERTPAYECFVESVLLLAFKAGLERDKALQPFDYHQRHASEFWAKLEQAV